MTPRADATSVPFGAGYGDQAMYGVDQRNWRHRS